MKTRITKIRNKILVSGDSNSLSTNEILVKDSSKGVRLFSRENGIVKNITFNPENKKPQDNFEKVLLCKLHIDKNIDNIPSKVRININYSKKYKYIFRYFIRTYYDLDHYNLNNSLIHITIVKGDKSIVSTKEIPLPKTFGIYMFNNDFTEITRIDDKEGKYEIVNFFKYKLIIHDPSSINRYMGNVEFPFTRTVTLFYSGETDINPSILPSGKQEKSIFENARCRSIDYIYKHQGTKPLDRINYIFIANTNPMVTNMDLQQIYKTSINVLKVKVIIFRHGILVK